LRNEYPDIKCIAYSPPGGLISKDLSDYAKSFVLSVVLGDDIVPRLSVHSIHGLKLKMMKEIIDSKSPKYKIFWNYTFGGSKNEDTSDDADETQVLNDNLENRIDSDDEITKNDDTINESVIVTLNKDETPMPSESKQDEELIKVKNVKKQIKKTYPSLYLPGNIIYIFHNNKLDPQTNKKRYFTKVQQRPTHYEFRWAHRNEFKRILITNQMVSDHYPIFINEAFNYIQTNRIV
jgi:sn1-specific diacylglycerol lipase